MLDHRRRPASSLPVAQDSAKVFRKSSLVIALYRQIVRTFEDLMVVWFGIAMLP